MTRLTSLVLTMLALPCAHAATFTPTRFDDPAPNGCAATDCSLREAVIAANATAASDVIQLAAGTYSLTRSCATESASCYDLDITQPLKIIGHSALGTEIINDVPLFSNPMNPVPADRTQTRVIDIAAGPVTLDKLSLRAGSVLGNSANSASGGCLKAQSSAVFLNDVNISQCAAEGSGSDGGAVAVSFGGGLTMTRVRISKSSAASSGGGLYVASATVTGTDVGISSNFATYGGGVFLGGASLQLGGGSRIADNVADFGGGIYANLYLNPITIGGTGPAAADRLAIEDNLSNNSGGGISAAFTTLLQPQSTTIRNLALRRNQAATDGGGVYLSTTSGTPISILSSEFSANEAGQNGGGLFLFAPAAGTNSVAQRLSFWDNIAGNQGGAIHHLGSMPLRHVSSYRNTAFNGGNSLLVVNSAAAVTPRISHFTTHNEGQTAIVLGRSVEFTASALDGGCSGPAIDLGFNFRNSVFSGCPGSAVAAAQMGLSFGNFGGWQSVVGISSTSALRNGALNAPGALDARGYLRQGLADIGAFEFDGIP